MSKMDLFCNILKNFKSDISPIEKILLEAKIIINIYRELSTIFKSRYENYQKLIKSQEEYMLNVNFMKEIINDIISSEEYSLTGIANYTSSPEEVLSDIAAGINTNPTFVLSMKIFELHATVRPDLYNRVMRKVVSEYISTECPLVNPELHI